MNKLLSFLPFAIIITGLSFLIYLSGQYVLRQGANDPQVQISEEIARNLDNGQKPEQIINPVKSNLAQTLAFYAIVFDHDGKIAASTVELDGKDPEVPIGVLEHAKQHGQNRVTWEPKPGVRQAAIITSYKDGTVLVARSLREVDSRIQQLRNYVLGGWAGLIILSFISYQFVSLKGIKK